MIHTDSDEGPVPIEWLQFQAARAKDAELAELRTRLERIEQAAKNALEIWQQTQIAGSHGIPLCDAMIGLRAALENADG